METQCKNDVFLHNAWKRNTGKQKELQITSIKHYIKKMENEKYANCGYSIATGFHCSQVRHG